MWIPFGIGPLTLMGSKESTAGNIFLGLDAAVQIGSLATMITGMVWPKQQQGFIAKLVTEKREGKDVPLVTIAPMVSLGQVGVKGAF